METKCIIFDMDGVLVNTEPVHFELWKRVYSDFGVELDWNHFKKCIGSTAGYLFDITKAEYGIDFQDRNELVQRFKKYKKERISNGTGLPEIRGVSEVLPYLKEKGYRMAVASSTRQEYIDISMEKLGFSQYFEVMFSAEHVEKSKPAPDVFLRVAEMMEIEPSECLVIEDSMNGCLAAQAAGMKCFGFANPDSGEQDLSSSQQTFYPFVELKNMV